MDKRLEEVLQRNNIDPATVIDARTEVVYSYMWRTPTAWPAGGTYEGQPRGAADVAVAHRVTTTVAVEIIGRHPGARVLMTSPEDGERSKVELVDEGPWIFEE